MEAGHGQLPNSVWTGTLGTAVTAAGPGFDCPNVGHGGEDDLNFRLRPVAKK